MIYVAMDIHKKTTTYCAIDQGGEIIRRGKVSSGEAGWLKIVQQWPMEEVRVALETGGMSWWVVDVLRGAGLEPVVVDARRFKLIADSKKKSDRRDARTLAEALKGGLAENCSASVPSERARRERWSPKIEQSCKVVGTATMEGSQI